MGRANTDTEKEQLIRRLLEAWKSTPNQRLSQLIFNATNGRDIFYTEDYDFVKEIESYASSIVPIEPKG